MISDRIENLDRYKALHKHFPKAFSYLKSMDFVDMPDGKYTLDDDV